MLQIRGVRKYQKIFGVVGCMNDNLTQFDKKVRSEDQDYHLFDPSSNQ